MNLKFFRKDIKTDFYRGLRIALATGIAVLLYRSLHITNGYWVLLSTIITIQANLGASIKRAKDRIFGTILGVLIGVMLAVLFPQNLLFILMIAPVLIFFALYLFRASYAYAIFFASILLILLLSQAHITPWHFAANRIVATLLGVAIGLIASYFFWPSCAQYELQRHLAESVEKFSEFFKFVVEGFFARFYDEEALQQRKAELQLALQNNRQTLQEFSYEPGVMRVSSEAALSFIMSLERIHDILMSMTVLLRNPVYEAIADDEAVKLKSFIVQVEQMFVAIIKHSRGESEQPSSVVLDRMAIRLEQQLITSSVLREALITHASHSLNLIILVRGMKRIAAELKYMAESMSQLETLHGSGRMPIAPHF